MIAFQVRLTRLRPPGVTQREFNNWVRFGLLLAGEHWVENYLPLHFEQGAYQRYDYAPRTKRTLAKKQKAAQTGSIRASDGRIVPAQSPPRPWVWSGDAKQALLGRAGSSFNMRVSATANVQTVRVPLPIRHPIHPRHKGELSRLINSEAAAMKQVVLREVNRQKLLSFTVTTEVIG